MNSKMKGMIGRKKKDEIGDIVRDRDIEERYEKIEMLRKEKKKLRLEGRIVKNGEKNGCEG